MRQKAEHITIEKLTISDLEQLQQIGRQTFYETFAEQNSEQNMKKYLENAFSTEKLKAEITDANTSFYFARTGKKIIGYLKLNSSASQTEIQDNNAIEIERIYVLKEFIGKGVGRVLCEKAIEIAKRKKMDYIWLGVWENNLRALNFYQKNGFVTFDKHIFKLGEDEQTDIMMRRKL